MTENEILLKAYQSLLFNIPKNLRFLTIEKNENKLNAIAYFNYNIYNSDKDCIFSIIGETCGHFVELEAGNCELIVSTDAYENLPKLRHTVFAEYEGPLY